MRKGISRLLTWIKDHWLWVGGGIILLLIIGFWWQNRQQGNQEELTFTQAEYRDLTKTVEFSGQVDAQERVRLRFAAGGKISYIGAKKGEEVKKHQTIASLDQRSVQKQLEKTLSSYQTERWDYENATDTRDDRWLDDTEQREADQDQFLLDRSVIDVQLQSLAIDNYRLTAPFAGILVDAPIEVPGVVALATDTWELVNPDTLFFWLAVDEVDVDQVYVGQLAQVQLDAYPDKVFLATISKVDYKTLTTASGSVFPVELTFSEPVSIDEVRVGMNGEARLIQEEKQNVLAIPVDALQVKAGQDIVEVWRDGKVQDQPVELGLETDDYAEIISGITTSDQIVLP